MKNLFVLFKYKNYNEFYQIHQFSFNSSTSLVQKQFKKMKFVLAFSTLAIVLATSINAAITRPDQVLIELTTLETEIISYQFAVLQKIESFRLARSTMDTDYWNRTLTVIKANIRNISSSDTNIRSALAAETQTACNLNLANFLDQIIELSGYAISNCVEARDAVNETVSFEALEALYNFEEDVHAINVIITNALIGRNIFIEGPAIVARVQEQLVAKRAVYGAIFQQIISTSSTITEMYDKEIDNLQTCFSGVETSIQGGISAVRDQLPVCITFGARGARSLLVKPSDFFPELNLSN